MPILGPLDESICVCCGSTPKNPSLPHYCPPPVPKTRQEKWIEETDKAIDDVLKLIEEIKAIN